MNRDDPASWHAHQCPTCCAIWQHQASSRDNELAHTCPRCGEFSLERMMANPSAVTNINTVGNGVLTAAALVGGAINRTGPAAAFTDTTDSATNIIAALPANTPVGYCWPCAIFNQSSFLETIKGGAGVTAAGAISPQSTAIFELTYTGTGQVSMFAYSPNSFIAPQFTSGVVTGTFPQYALTGGNPTIYLSLAALPGTINTRTATQMLQDMNNVQTGMNWIVRIINAGGSTMTVGAGTGVTITGSATIAASSWREYLATVTNTVTPAITFQNLGTGTYS